jgi:hypothetical protein
VREAVEQPDAQAARGSRPLAQRTLDRDFGEPVTAVARRDVETSAASRTDLVNVDVPEPLPHMSLIRTLRGPPVRPTTPQKAAGIGSTAGVGTVCDGFIPDALRT